MSIARQPVTPATVKVYLDRRMNGSNYYLLYGLHLLSPQRYAAVMDALINGELEAEELVRLGGFTDAEADALIRESLGSWVSPSVAEPRTGEDGYAYLSDTLGLGGMVLAAAVAPPGWRPGRLLGSSVRVGKSGHSGYAEVEAIYAERVADVALAGMVESLYFPADEAAVRALPVAASSQARRDVLWALCRESLSPLMGPGTPLFKLLAVGARQSSISSAPGLAQWVTFDPRPHGNTRLLMHREAAVRSLVGLYTKEDIVSMLDGIAARPPSFVATGRCAAGIDFSASVALAAATAHFPGSDVEARARDVKAAVDAFFAHRDRLRGFADRLLRECSRTLIGDYSPS